MTMGAVRPCGAASRTSSPTNFWKPSARSGVATGPRPSMTALAFSRRPPASTASVSDTDTTGALSMMRPGKAALTTAANRSAVTLRYPVDRLRSNCGNRTA